MLAVVSMPVAAQADLDVSACAFPDAPGIPDGNAATVTEMSESGAAVRAYVTTGEEQLKCLEGVLADMGEEHTEEQRLRVTDIYNAGVDQLTRVATAYNEAVQAYRANNPAE